MVIIASDEAWRRLGYGEDVIRGRWQGWFNQIIRDEGHPYGGCDVQLKVQVFDTQLYDDIVIWKKGAVGRDPACIIELKLPTWTALENEVIKDALRKKW